MAGVYTQVKEAVRYGLWNALRSYYPDEATAPIIYSHLNGAEPDESYVVINLLGIYPQGRGSSATLTSTTFQNTYSANYEIQYRILFVGSKGADMAHDVAHKLSANPIIQDAFRSKKLGYMRKSTIAYSPVKRETQWIDYHTLDITFSYQVVSQEDIDYFDSAIINGVVSNEGGVEVYNETFAVPETTPIPPL